MGNESHYERFGESTELIRAGRYREALQILNVLNDAHPNTKNVIYSAALCLEQLGKPHRALPLCDQLIKQFDDPRAHEMMARIKGTVPPANGPTEPEMPDYIYADIVGVSERAARTPAPARFWDDWDWKQALVWGVLLSAVALAVIALWQILTAPLPSTVGEASTPAATAQSIFPRPLRPSPYSVPSRALFTLIFGSALGTVAADGALKILDKLKGHNLLTNMAHIGATMLILQTLRIASRIIQLGINSPETNLLITIVAIILSIQIMVRAFELGFGDFFKFAVLYAIFAVVLAFPLGVIFGRTLMDLQLR